MEYLRLSWQDIEKQCLEIARKIRREKIEFDIIVALSRGGLIPGRLLSDYLANEELYTVRVKFYSGIGETHEKPRIIHPVQIDVRGKKVLLVDDIADTGRSLLLAKQHLEERGCGEVTVATLVKKPKSIVEPDIYIMETNAWVVFPWEVMETARLLAKQHSGEELRKAAEKAGISESELKTALEL